MKISDIRLLTLDGLIDSAWRGVDRSARPLDRYPEFNNQEPDRPSGEDSLEKLRAYFLEIQTDEGLSGIYGPLDYVEQSFIIHHQIRPFLLGRNPLEIEKLWDQMHRMDRHAHSGMFLMAISAVDCALWDLRGKYYGKPVYALLGGPTRAEVKAYASCLGFSVDPERAAQQSRVFLNAGFEAQKWFFRHGPGSGTEGMKKNLALAEALRGEVGDDSQLMFDCWMGWNVEYTLSMAKQLAPLEPKWLEEPLPPYDLDGYRAIARASLIPLSAGEHLYTRWGVKPFLDAHALSYVQPDPDWTGGITELRRIAFLAELYGIELIPHGCTVHAALHVVASLPPTVCPYVEYLVKYQEKQQHFFLHPLKPVEGAIRLPQSPGLGIELDFSKITSLTDTFPSCLS